MDTSTPRTIQDAGKRLDVAPSTIWRRLRAHGYSDVTSESWDAIKQDIESARLWRMLKHALVGRGKSDSAARKQVQRWKRGGADPQTIARKLLDDNS
jgi:hypothetical protein